MTVHLIKLAAGIDDVEALAALQNARMEEARAQGQAPYPRHYTRYMPRRKSQVLDGGSIYWVIRGAVRARNRIVALETYRDEEGVERCLIVVDPHLIRTRVTGHRAFQGWRYLEPAKAPPDFGDGDRVDDDMPPELARELDDLGLV
ncbi:MAG: DUF1489 domain-containing protein [Alphaproteobacteria bacterium]|nr:DUF1489 domain-containing protein [Alphaproteobacteria bacterium]MBF0251235.1 DUF1489 domain-containing protein [Alphaproteobacteria bacterium]